MTEDHSSTFWIRNEVHGLEDHYILDLPIFVQNIVFQISIVFPPDKVFPHNAPGVQFGVRYCCMLETLIR